MKAVVVLAGEVEAGPRAKAALADARLVVAADGGADRLAPLGVVPDVLIGDVDSVSPERVALLDRGRTEVIRYPTRKDQTDSELAVLEAVRRGATELTILGALGGPRVDHALASVFLVAHPKLRGIPVRVLTETAEIKCVAGGTLEIDGEPGELVSLVPITRTVRGVCMTGVEWPLEDAELELGSSHTVSNVFTSARMSVSVREGALLVVHLFGAQD